MLTHWGHEVNMATSQYFNNYNAKYTEQRLVEDLIIESIKIQGFDAYYLPNDNDVARDLLYGEDPTKRFNNAFPLEMYLSNATDYNGEREMFSKFGLEIKNQVSVIVAKRTFSLRVPQNTPVSLQFKKRLKKKDILRNQQEQFSHPLRAEHLIKQKCTILN